MNRRQYLRAACGVALTTATAGCSLGGETRPTETVIVAVPGEGDAAQQGGAAVPPDVTEIDAPEIDLDPVRTERVSENEFTVEGGLRNASDRPFDHVELEVEIYDANEAEDELLDNASVQEEFEFLAPGATWSFTLPFEDTPIGTVDYAVVTAWVNLAPTPTGTA